MNRLYTSSVILLIFGTVIAGFGMVSTDRNVPATPEVQGLVTATGMNVQGTATETDSAVWSTTSGGIPLSGDDPILANYPNWGATHWGTYEHFLFNWHHFAGPELNYHLQDMLYWYQYVLPDPGVPDLVNWLSSQGGLHNPPLHDREVRYTTGYSDNTMAVSGQTSFVKSVAVSTGNRIADQSNLKASTSMQFIAIGTGRVTRTEDLLLDGTAQSTNTSTAILCPFASAVSPVIPAYCNIVQAGSAIDAQLTSVTTSADTRFVGTDSTFPVVLNYNINAEGLAIGSQSSPMIGSASAFMKVHVQEARTASTATYQFEEPFTVTLDPIKSEDIVYSESSSASGLINKFNKDMHYQSGFNLI